MSSPAVLLVFDGECGFCRRWVRNMQKWFSRHPQPIAWQEADLAALGLTEAECRQAVQFIYANGRVFSGGRAVAEILKFAGLPYSLAGQFMTLPGVRHIAEMTYQWVARNRHRTRGD